MIFVLAGSGRPLGVSYVSRFAPNIIPHVRSGGEFIFLARAQHLSLAWGAAARDDVFEAIFYIARTAGRAVLVALDVAPPLPASVCVVDSLPEEGHYLATVSFICDCSPYLVDFRAFS